MQAWLAGVLMAAGLAAAPLPARADPDALWKIVHGRCVPNEQTNHDPKPCAAVDLAGGYAILKDINGATQFLLIPTAPLGGIESPDILRPDAPNYFAAAWAARSYVQAAAHRPLPRDAVGLAINSTRARSQNQFHIHIDCLALPVIEALRSHIGEISDAWSVFPVTLAGHRYLARRIGEPIAAQPNPFRLLADGVPGAAADMGLATLVLAGAIFADGEPGGILLADHLDLMSADFAHGEDLQDHACAVASEEH